MTRFHGRFTGIWQILPRLSSLLVFPLAALFNNYAATLLLLLFGLAGNLETVSDIALVQGATLALFYAFSANARNLVLGDASGSTAAHLLRVRLLLLPLMAAATWILSVTVSGADAWLAGVLILRRMTEWISEVAQAQHEKKARLRRCASIFCWKS
jgi:hypothetical protein